jgi:uncharacterized protein (TIGR01777 family)
MRIIIPGGSGLIGRALTADLTAVGYEVVILSRSPEKVKGLPGGARAEGWDGQSAAGWGHLADGAGAIVNLAGESLAAGRWTSERKRRILESRVKPGQAVVEAVEAAQNKPGVVIQSSAVGFYGPRGDEEIAETAAPGTDFLANLCREWEASTAPIGGMGVRLVVIRTGLVLSLEGGALPRILLPFKLFVGGPVGSGRQWWPWIHIADVVPAILFLIETETAPGPYNLTAPNPLTNTQFSRVVGRVLGRPALMPVPAFALQLLFGEMSTVLLDGQRVMPYALREAGFTFRFPDAESALQDLLA